MYVSCLWSKPYDLSFPKKVWKPEVPKMQNRRTIVGDTSFEPGGEPHSENAKIFTVRSGSRKISRWEGWSKSKKIDNFHHTRVVKIGNFGKVRWLRIMLSYWPISFLREGNLLWLHFRGMQKVIMVLGKHCLSTCIKGTHINKKQLANLSVWQSPVLLHCPLFLFQFYWKPIHSFAKIA